MAMRRRRRFVRHTQSDLLRPFGFVSPEERQRAEAFYLDLFGWTPPRAGAESGMLEEDATEDAAEDQTKTDLRDRAIDKARSRGSFLSEATVRTAVDGRASRTELQTIFDTGVAAAVPAR